jgi:hypothetical protein
VTRFRVDLFCGWFMDNNSKGVELSPENMLTPAQRGIKLSFDTYGPEASDGLEPVSQT